MFSSKYGVARHIYINVPKAGSANHAVGADWTPAAGDVKVSKDGGAAANVTNLPVAVAMGNSALWDFHLTATEMQAAQLTINSISCRGARRSIIPIYIKCSIFKSRSCNILNSNTKRCPSIS